MKPLSPVEPVEPINNLESPMNSDIGKQDGIQGSDDSEERDSNPKPHATEKRRTEYLFEDPLMVENKDITPGEGASPVAEKRTRYQCEGEGEESIVPIVDGLETSQTPLRDALQSSIKHRLAQLHISTDFNFTSGLAAQVAARSLTFTTMQEQTFGDEEEAEEEMQDSENHMQENNDEGTVSENGEVF